MQPLPPAYSRILQVMLVIAAVLWAYQHLLFSAWVGDDAFITFRVVDNFVQGYGLRWNVHERVQAYTNPLWMLLHIPFYAAYPDIMLITCFLSMTLVLVTILLVAGTTPKSGVAMVVLMILPLMMSLSWKDFAVSGLENPLSYFLFALFGWLLWTREKREWGWFYVSVSFALALVNRLDAVVLYLPPLLAALWFGRKTVRHWQVAAGMLPIVLWLGFSLFYYGFLFPNTKYAKLNSCLPEWEYIQRGWLYLKDYIATDTVGAMVMAAGLFAGGRHLFKRWRAWGYEEYCILGVLAGICANLVYVVLVGGDFMIGRFFTVPFFASWWLLYRLLPAEIGWTRAVAIAVLLVFASYAAQAKRQQRYQCPDCSGINENGLADERYFYSHGNTLLYFDPNIGQWALRSVPQHKFMKQLPGIIQSRERVSQQICIGMLGFYAGPERTIIDEIALSDAFLARMPNQLQERWRIGHLKRLIPDGYFYVVRSGDASYLPPNLAQYYQKLRVITAGPLWSWYRLKMIWRFNTGQYDNLLPQCPK